MAELLETSGGHPKEKEELENAFSKADGDKDGFLTAEEIPALLLLDAEGSEGAEDAEADAIQSMMEDGDTDKDGKMSIAELLQTADGNPEAKKNLEKAFSKADGDKDGFLTAEEIPALLLLDAEGSEGAEDAE